MSAPQRNTSYFPELEGQEQSEADEWFAGYLRLVIRIHREHRESEQSSYPQLSVDQRRGTGRVCTAYRPPHPPQK